MKVATGTSVSILALAWCSNAFAQAQVAGTAGIPAPAKSSARLEEVVVTAQKRSQKVQSIGMSIQAISGATLTAQGVKSTGDLKKVVPGFHGDDNNNFDGVPNYAIRGIGYHDPSLAANPTVGIYNDQIPLPFSIESLGSVLDLQRVEVLKGPQGTLFGDNSTGGAINFIANKPTDHLEAGADIQYGNYNTLDASGFVSGPLTNNLDARLALRTIQGDGYEKNYINGQTLGARDFTDGRLTLDWRPSDRLTVLATVTGFDDHSQTLAPQFEGIKQLSFNAPLPPGLLNFPIAPDDNRAAAFPACINDSPFDNHCVGYARDNKFYLASLRADYDLGGDMTLTSLTSYEQFNEYQPQDQDGTTFQDFQTIGRGRLDTTYQELRLSGQFAGKGAWIVGGNFQHDNTESSEFNTFADSASGVLLGIPVVGTNVAISGMTNTYAGFGHAEYPVIQDVTVEAGLRLTQSDQTFAGCEYDNGNGSYAAISQILQNFFQTGTPFGPGINVGPGGCATLSGPPHFTPGVVNKKLDEGNASFRFGVNWKVASESLLYANVSQGYKAGAFSALSASEAYQYDPAVQERLIAYEAGFKTRLLNDTLQLNGAAFYYDYKNKQIQGSVLDVFFGDLPKLINIPHSHVDGFELSAVWKPLPGVTLSPAVSYAPSRIDGHFSTINFLGQTELMTGLRFPGDPEVQADIDAQYEFPVSDRWKAYIGTNISYQGSYNGEIGNLPATNVPGYTLVDLRSGMENGPLRLELWGRNVFNKYYYIDQLHVNDVYARFAGVPAMYGLTLSYRFK